MYCKQLRRVKQYLPNLCTSVDFELKRKKVPNIHCLLLQAKCYYTLHYPTQWDEKCSIQLQEKK